MRTAKQDETIISLHGSPIYVGQTARKNRRQKVSTTSTLTDHVEFGIGDGKKLVIPTDQEIGGDENAAPMDLSVMDQDAIDRLMKLRANLDKLLKNHFE